MNVNEEKIKDLFLNPIKIHEEPKNPIIETPEYNNNEIIINDDVVDNDFGFSKVKRRDKKKSVHSYVSSTKSSTKSSVSSKRSSKYSDNHSNKYSNKHNDKISTKHSHTKYSTFEDDISIASSASKLNDNKKDKKKLILKEKRRILHALKKYSDKEYSGVPILSMKDKIEDMRHEFDYFKETLEHSQSLKFYNLFLIAASAVIEKMNKKFDLGFNFDGLIEDTRKNSDSYAEILDQLVEEKKLSKPNPWFNLMIKYCTNIYFFHKSNDFGGIPQKMEKQSRRIVDNIKLNKNNSVGPIKTTYDQLIKNMAKEKKSTT